LIKNEFCIVTLVGSFKLIVPAKEGMKLEFLLAVMLWFVSFEGDILRARCVLTVSLRAVE
jgi:hypothetical protein